LSGVVIAADSLQSLMKV